MKRGYGFGAAAVAAIAAISLGCAREPVPQQTAAATPAAVPSALTGPGWTGLTEPAEVIEARKGLMDEAERLIKPIDLFTIGEPAELEELRSAAVTISRMLLAVPHLFPPTTNLYDPSVLESATNSLPAIWQDFDSFFGLAESAETAAAKMTRANGAEEMRTAALGLRASCDACHALYLKAYVPPTFTPEDFQFDFDSVLPQN